MKIRVNDIELFYEKTGQGQPIILLHGNGESHKIFDVLVQRLSQDHTVYAIDSRGHGKSGKVKTLDYHTMMEDVVSFIRALDIQNPILYGFSDGGIIGLLLAIKYPNMLSKLIVSGANLNPEGIEKRYLIPMKISYFFIKNKRLKLMLTQPDITEDDLSKIVTPTFITAGSRDFVKDEHTRHIARNIKGSALKILEGEDHVSYVLHSPKLYDVISPFLSV